LTKDGLRQASSINGFQTHEVKESLSAGTRCHSLINSTEEDRKSAFKLVTSSKKISHHKNINDSSEVSNQNTASLFFNKFRSRNQTSHELKHMDCLEDSLFFQQSTWAEKFFKLQAEISESEKQTNLLNKLECKSTQALSQQVNAFSDCKTSRAQIRNIYKGMKSKRNQKLESFSNNFSCRDKRKSSESIYKTKSFLSSSSRHEVKQVVKSSYDYNTVKLSRNKEIKMIELKRPSHKQQYRNGFSSQEKNCLNVYKHIKNGYVQLKRPESEDGRKNKSLNNLLEAHEQTSPLNLTKSAINLNILGATQKNPTSHDSSPIMLAPFRNFFLSNLNVLSSPSRKRTSTSPIKLQPCNNSDKVDSIHPYSNVTMTSYMIASPYKKRCESFDHSSSATHLPHKLRIKKVPSSSPLTFVPIMTSKLTKKFQNCDIKQSNQSNNEMEASDASNTRLLWSSKKFYSSTDQRKKEILKIRNRDFLRREKLRRSNSEDNLNFTMCCI